GLIEQEMGNRTNLTHKLNRLNSSRCHVAQPAQHCHCIMFCRQRQYTSNSCDQVVNQINTAIHVFAIFMRNRLDR
ncbi:MAG: hypothetical protein Q8L62_13945, partial [Candidatus Nitrotoga sp.]|nr:hypothetical protein [Candidatus Nitrotoga sp.]